MIIRVAKEDSVYLYQLLEAYESLANYSTVSADASLGYRDIKLYPAPDMAHELALALRIISKELPMQILEHIEGNRI